jgi:hypothetical protein
MKIFFWNKKVVKENIPRKMNSELKVGSGSTARPTTTLVSVEKFDNGFTVRYWSPSNGEKGLVCITLVDVSTELAKAFEV